MDSHEDLRARVKARLIAALKAADRDCHIEERGEELNVDGWFQIDAVIDAVIAEVRK